MSRQDKLIKRINKNPRVKELLQQIERGAFSVDIQKFDAEIEHMMQRRKIRSLGSHHEGKGLQTRLIKAVEREIGTRSRLVEMRLQVKRKSDMLNKYATSLKEYIKFRYLDRMKAIWTTAGDRNMVIDHLLSPATEQNEDLAALDERIGYVIEDIDKASWSTRNLVEALQLSMSRERLI